MLSYNLPIEELSTDLHNKTRVIFDKVSTCSEALFYLHYFIHIILGSVLIVAQSGFLSSFTVFPESKFLDE